MSVAGGGSKVGVGGVIGIIIIKKNPNTKDGRLAIGNVADAGGCRRRVVLQTLFFPQTYKKRILIVVHFTKHSITKTLVCSKNLLLARLKRR